MADNVYVSNTINLGKYMKLEQKGKVLAEYIWIDGSNGLRNKTKVSTILPSPISRDVVVELPPCLRSVLVLAYPTIVARRVSAAAGSLTICCGILILEIIE